MRNIIASLIVLCALTSASLAVPYTLMTGVSRYAKQTDGTVSKDFGSLYSSGEYTITITQNFTVEELVSRGLSEETLDTINGKFVIDAPFIDADLATAEGRERLSNYSFSSAKYTIEDFYTVYVIQAGGSTPKIPVLNVSATKTSVGEGGAASAVEIKLSRPAPAEFFIRYTLGGTAKVKTDYTGPKATRYVQIPKGKNTFRIPVRPVDDTSKESKETMVFTLAKNDGYKIGANKTVTINIRDND